MKTVYVMVGAPATGKSSWVKEQVEGRSDTFVLSSDEVRERTGKDHAGVFEQMRVILKSLLENHTPEDEQVKDIYWDATNTSRKRRRALYQFIKKCHSNVEVRIVFHSIPYGLAVARNTLRTGSARVPEHVIKRMYINQQPPRLGVDCDSFQVVGLPIIEQEQEDLPIHSRDINDIFKHTTSMHWDNELRLSDVPHDCPPWHLESIFEHINMTIENSEGLLPAVGFFHDLGKGITRVKDSSGFCTYRGHANVGACYALNWWGLTVAEGEVIDNNDTYTDSIEIVLRHMDQHQGLGKKNIRNNRLDPILEDIKEFGRIDSISRITRTEEDKIEKR